MCICRVNAYSAFFATKTSTQAIELAFSTKEVNFDFVQALNWRISTLGYQVAYREDTLFIATPDNCTSFCASLTCMTSLLSVVKAYPSFDFEQVYAYYLLVSRWLWGDLPAFTQLASRLHSASTANSSLLVHCEANKLVLQSLWCLNLTPSQIFRCYYSSDLKIKVVRWSGYFMQLVIPTQIISNPVVAWFSSCLLHSQMFRCTVV